MTIVQTKCRVSLPCCVNDIKSFTINCRDFFFLDRSGCNLIKWRQCTEAIETITLERKYLCICYDHKENCYWGISECDPYLIYQLDVCFCEVGHISLSSACQQRPTSLCCDGCGQGVWVCYPGQLAFVEKCSGKVSWYKNEDNRKINLGILMQCDCRVNCFYEGSRQIIEILSPCCHESIELCVPKNYKVVGMASCFCEHREGICHFYVLLSKGCSHEFTLAGYCVDFSQKQGGNCSPCSPAPEPCPPEPCPPGPCPPPFPPESHCGGTYEVMHSIALEEAGLAHILNAEGEKIQKAVAMSENIEQLICVNESVKRTLTQVTLLEGMLYSKLEALVSCDDFCHSRKPSCETNACETDECETAECNTDECAAGEFITSKCSTDEYVTAECIIARCSTDEYITAECGGRHQSIPFE